MLPVSDILPNIIICVSQKKVMLWGINVANTFASIFWFTSLRHQIVAMAINTQSTNGTVT